MPPKPKPGKHGPPKPPHPLGPKHRPPHLTWRGGFLVSIIVSVVVAAIFYYVLHIYEVPLAGAVPASVALWVGLVTITYKLLEK